MSSLRVKAYAAIVSEGREVVVADNASGVVVTWLCGESRVFTTDAAAQLVSSIDALAKHHDVWLSSKDVDGLAFAVQTAEGGKVKVVNSASGFERGDPVDWKPIRKALMKIIKQRTPTTPDLDDAEYDESAADDELVEA